MGGELEKKGAQGNNTHSDHQDASTIARAPSLKVKFKTESKLQEADSGIAGYRLHFLCTLFPQERCISQLSASLFLESSFTRQ